MADHNFGSMRILVAVMTGCVLWFLALPVVAGVSSKPDPNDVRGPLDIKRIAHGHADGDTLWHKVVMHKRWGANDLKGDEIRFYFSNDREDRYDEVHALVGLKDGKLAAWIFQYVEGSDYASVGPSTRIRLVRPSRRSVKIFFQESWMRNRNRRYAWSVGSRYGNRDSNHCREACYDYAPGRNPDRLVHNL